jgi:hypothetical protein
MSSYRKRCSSDAKVRISGAISRFSLQVFVNPFVFLVPAGASSGRSAATRKTKTAFTKSFSLQSGLGE